MSKEKDSNPFAINELVIAGRVDFLEAETSQRHGRVAVANSKHFAFLFPVSSIVDTILNTPVDQRQPADRYLLENSLNDLERAHIPASLIRFFSEAFEVDEQAWSYAKGFITDDDGKYCRIVILFPPKSDDREDFEYVSATLTRIRLGQEPVVMTFSRYETGD